MERKGLPAAAGPFSPLRTTFRPQSAPNAHRPDHDGPFIPKPTQ